MGKEVQAYFPPMCHPESLTGVIRERTAGVRTLEISSPTCSMTVGKDEPWMFLHITADPKAGKMGTGDDLTGSNGIN